MKTIMEYLINNHVKNHEDDSTENEIFTIVFNWCKNSIANDYIPSSRKDTWEFYKYSVYAVADAYDLFKSMYEEEPTLRKHFSNADELEEYIKNEDADFTKLAEEHVNKIYN